MICTKCGCRIDEGSLFCPVCGTKLTQPAEPPAADEVEPTAAEVIPSVAETVSAPVTVQPEAPRVQSSERKEKAVKPEQDKDFFGRGAFIFCLLLIMLLAASTGMFAYLYFSAIGAV